MRWTEAHNRSGRCARAREEGVLHKLLALATHTLRLCHRPETVRTKAKAKTLSATWLHNRRTKTALQCSNRENKEHSTTQQPTHAHDNTWAEKAVVAKPRPPSRRQQHPLHAQGHSWLQIHPELAVWGYKTPEHLYRHTQHQRWSGCYPHRYIKDDSRCYPHRY